ncbi:MAG: DUF983 domain-containing protein [Hyphomicrobiaceae bacterium]|nr:DUF983 domain-containing protein [Hyphomicrobiaceae bacterium]
MNTVEYSNTSHDENAHQEARHKLPAMLHGARQKCPNCGKGSIFTSFLKVAESCENCGQELHHERSDDAAPYFTIFVLGHLIVPLLLILETHIFPPLWTYLVIGIPLIITLTLLTLPRVKGAIIGLQWALQMHGFGPEEEISLTSPLDPELTGR